jgi:hypothetical protein
VPTARAQSAHAPQNASRPALAEPGTPVRSATTITRDGTAEGAAGEPLMGWSVIEAADRGAAVRLMQGHPFIARGGKLQVSEPV